MPQYVSLVKWTEQGVRNVKDAPKRLQAARTAIQNTGGKLLWVGFTLGEYDAVLISEATDDLTVSAVTLALGSLGNVRTTTIRAFTEAEFSQILAKFPSV